MGLLTITSRHLKKTFIGLSVDVKCCYFKIKYSYSQSCFFFYMAADMYSTSSETGRNLRSAKGFEPSQLILEKKLYLVTNSTS